jgi:glutathione S-transferase
MPQEETFPLITLYGNLKATCTQRILILLEELNLEHHFVPIDLGAGEQKSKEFLELQPFGKVPVLKFQEDKDSEERVLFESRAILRYLAGKYDEVNDLYPDVYTDVWLEADSQNLTPLVSKIVYEKMFKKMRNQECDEAVVEKTLDDLKKVLEVYNTHFKTHKFMGGNTFTIADIAALPYLNYFIKCSSKYKEYLKEYKYFYHWFKKVMNRESVKKVFSQ